MVGVPPGHFILQDNMSQLVYGHCTLVEKDHETGPWDAACYGYSGSGTGLWVVELFWCNGDGTDPLVAECWCKLSGTGP